MDLVDGLGSAPVAQLGRAIGGQDDERDAAEVRLGHGRQEIGGGGTGGGEEGDRRADLPGHAEGNECR
jgi:hypothetical protein